MFLGYTELSPLAIIGDWSICRGPGWLLGLMGALFGPILPCMAPCCPGPDAPRGGAEAEPTQPSCCCMPGRGPPGAISPRGANTHGEMRNSEKCLRTDLSGCPWSPWCNGAIWGEKAIYVVLGDVWGLLICGSDRNFVPVWVTKYFLSQEVSHCAMTWYVTGWERHTEREKGLSSEFGKQQQVLTKTCKRM